LLANPKRAPALGEHAPGIQRQVDPVLIDATLRSMPQAFSLSGESSHGLALESKTPQKAASQKEVNEVDLRDRLGARQATRRDHEVAGPDLIRRAH
jgi:hypothetical protein